MIFYKVLDSDLTSARCGNLQYSLNEWIKPEIKNSRIFVFQDLKKALGFRDCDERIFACEVWDPIPLLRICGNKFDLPAFWRIDEETSQIDAPNGTIGVKAIKLLHEVKIQEEE